MRCRKHSTDLSSIVGVCASCLRQRLLLLIEAQSQQQQQQHNSDHRKSDAAIPPDVLVFPRSVSPYITRRKSDNAATWQPPPSSQLQHSLSDHRFFSTPQIGPNGAIVADSLYRKETTKKKRDKFSVFSRLFRSKTQRFDSDSRVFDTKSRESVASGSTTTSSWFSKIKAKSRTTSFGNNKIEERSGRGMSPRTVDSDKECGCSSESSPRWKATPNRGGRQRNESRNMSAGLAFCLSPLVRPSPNHQWNSKGMPPAEAAVLADAAGFRANRSRKLANFGRFHPDY